jgi:hypothetical protein
MESRLYSEEVGDSAQSDLLGKLVIPIRMRDAVRLPFVLGTSRCGLPSLEALHESRSTYYSDGDENEWIGL